MAYQRVLKFAQLSDTGKVRAHNEDAILVRPDYGCAVLADGMGGYNAGEVASAMTVQIISDYLCQKIDTIWFPAFGPRPVLFARWMVEAIELANQNVLSAARTHPECSGMGTTVVVACCCQDKLLLAHVGDSRAYRYRQGELQRLTHDHSVLQEQIDAGFISEADARFSSIKNLITRAVGAHEYLDVELHVHPASELDIYMLCSDGLTDMLGNDEICSILDQCGHNLQAACNVLVQAANILGGNDNISVILFQIDPEKKKAWVARKKSR